MPFEIRMLQDNNKEEEKIANMFLASNIEASTWIKSITGELNVLRT